MSHQQIENLIEFVCLQFENQIAQSGISNQNYLTILGKFPEKIKEQAKKSLDTLEQNSPIKLLMVTIVRNDYLKSINELNQAFRQCTALERLKITQAQLAPFQVDQFARQLALAPGIILAYEHVTGQKR